MAYDEQLEIAEPHQAPTAIATLTDNLNDHDQEFVESKPNLTIDGALDHLNEMRKLFVDNDVLFTQVNLLYNAITANEISSEITKKNKQSIIGDFFNPRQNE